MRTNPLPIPVPEEETEYLSDLHDMLEHTGVSPSTFFDAALSYATGEGSIPDVWFEHPKTLQVLFMTVRLINGSFEYLHEPDQLKLSCISASLEIEQLIESGALTPAGFADQFQTVARLVVIEGRLPTEHDDLGPAKNALYLIAQMFMAAAQADRGAIAYVVMITDLIRSGKQKPRDLVEYLRDCVLVRVYGIGTEPTDAEPK